MTMLKTFVLIFLACAVCAFSDKLSQRGGTTPACKDALKTVANCIQDRKFEVNININEKAESKCNMQVWRKVDPSMVSNSYAKGVKATLTSDQTGGLIIKANVVSHGCGNGPGSTLVVHIKEDWKQIMYTQVFKGMASCWGIFGNKYDQHNLKEEAGLEVFNPSFGDIIFGQKKMKSSSVDTFDGRSVRCDNEGDNFWHGNNGNGERQATVILRRRKNAANAGLQTGTSCGTPQYVIKDIYVLI